MTWVELGEVKWWEVVGSFKLRVTRLESQSVNELPGGDE